MLNTYLQRVQTILHDFNGSLYGSPLNLTAIINQSRHKVALMGQCVRFIIPSSSGIGNISLTSAGTGYTTTPTLTVSGPDLPNGVSATLGCSVSGGSIASVGVGNYGSGYVNIPTVTVSGGGGSGGIITVTSLTPTPLTTFQGQELYAFSDANALFAGINSQGIASIQALFSVAVSQGNIKPLLLYMPFTEFQAYCRVFEGTTQNYPRVWTQYGQGAMGSIYLFPVPSGTYSMDWDCVCIPADLASDSDPEAIPYPWTEAVPYYAAMLCYEYAQRNDDADKMQSKFTQKMMEARSFSSVAEIPDVYEEND